MTDWVLACERSANGDDTALTTALRHALDQLSAGLQGHLDGAPPGAGTIAALDWARTQIAPLHRLSCLPALPDGIRADVDNECRRWVERSQAAIELSAAHVDDQGLLALIVRRIPLRWPSLLG